MAQRREVPGDTFHVPGARVYAGHLGPAIHKSAADMAHVAYAAVHENRDFPPGDDRRGHGREHATWVFSEEPGLAEGLFRTGLELVIDARLEPGAAIGLHRHAETEEVYYLLEGELLMTTVLPGGQEVAQALRAGDAHGVRLGEEHFGRAGPAGCRFIAIATRRR
jgi:quercetin dioxygenase-like cupin family protein